MNSCFSTKRFLWLISCHLSENRKLYLASLGGLGFFLLYMAIIQERDNLLSGMFPVTFCIAGCLITANCYGKWSDFGHASSYLLIPATQLEKYLVTLTVGIVLFIPCFTLLYFVTGYLFRCIFHPPVSLMEMITGGYPVRGIFGGLMENTLLAYLLLQSFFMVIATRFKKLQFLIGALFVVVIFTSVVYVNLHLLSNLSHTVAFNYTFFMVGGPVGYYEIGAEGGTQTLVNVVLQPWVYNINKLVYLLIATGFYIAAWFGLKEREI